MLSKKLAFAYGALGSVLPVVVNATKQAATQVLTAPPSGWTIYVTLVLIASVGAGLLSVAWKPDSEWKAIWVGASMPVILQALTASAPAHQ